MTIVVNPIRGLSANGLRQTMNGVMITSRLVLQTLSAGVSLAFMLLFTACGHRGDAESLSGDAKLSKTIIGNWTNSGGWILSFAPNRKYASCSSNAHWVIIRNYEGEWWIADGSLILITTNRRSWGTSNTPPLHGMNRIKILSLDDRKLITEWEGQTNSYVRKEWFRQVRR